MTRRVPFLEESRSKGVWAEYYDPEGARYGLPTYPFHYAPAGFLTRRQLRERGLRPGGQDVQGQILWRHRNQRRVAYLYEEQQAKPKRVATPAQLAAIDKALTARKTCPSCGLVKAYCLPKSLGECLECAEGARRDPQSEPEDEAEREAS
jgi:hypothetical protein